MGTISIAAQASLLRTGNLHIKMHQQTVLTEHRQAYCFSKYKQRTEYYPI